MLHCVGDKYARKIMIANAYELRTSERNRLPILFLLLLPDFFVGIEFTSEAKQLHKISKKVRTWKRSHQREDGTKSPLLESTE